MNERYDDKEKKIHESLLLSYDYYDTETNFTHTHNTHLSFSQNKNQQTNNQTVSLHK